MLHCGKFTQLTEFLDVAKYTAVTSFIIIVIISYTLCSQMMINIIFSI
jgi:hypothetical protein